MRSAVDESRGKGSVPIQGLVAPVLGSAAGSGGGQAILPGQKIADGFWSGNYASGNEGTRTIEDAAAWAALWRTLFPSRPPTVDFAQSELVAVFLGPRPTGGYAVEFVEIKRTPAHLLVRYREQAPPLGQTPPEGATSPYAIKAIPRSNLPVRFEKVR